MFEDLLAAFEFGYWKNMYKICYCYLKDSLLFFLNTYNCLLSSILLLMLMNPIKCSCADILIEIKDIFKIIHSVV